MHLFYWQFFLLLFFVFMAIILLCCCFFFPVDSLSSRVSFHLCVLRDGTIAIRSGNTTRRFKAPAREDSQPHLWKISYWDMAQFDILFTSENVYAQVHTYAYISLSLYTYIDNIYIIYLYIKKKYICICICICVYIDI